MFFGRKKELAIFESCYNSRNSELIVLYGRRRVGKSSLVKTFAESKRYYYNFEAIEGWNTQKQIIHFTASLAKQINDPMLRSVKFQTWDDVFTYLTDKVIQKRNRKKKIILLFDEIQWMAAGRNALISLIKYYWDIFWKENNIMLILCGSIASFVVNKIVKSKALYGRITCEINLKGLNPNEAACFFSKRKSKEEILRYFLIFGTIPKYLEIIKQNKSFSYNLNSLCFSAHGVMLNEVERIFYNQFRETRVYSIIVMHMISELVNLDTISKKTKIPSGGGLKRYLTNLELAEIIRKYIPFNKKSTSKMIRYTLSDEFLIFYYKYIYPNIKIIEESDNVNLFENITKSSFEIWLGFAFERFCIKHAYYLAEKMGFAEKVKIASPYFERNDKSFQIDLLYQRFDNVITICEIKYHNKEISTGVIADMERKIKFIKIPRGYSIETVLISIYGPNSQLKNTAFFDRHITIDDII